MSSKTKTTATKEDATPTLVPKLWFPEFRGTEGWTTETLGSVAKISTEKVGNNTCIPMSVTSGVGLVSQMDKFGRIIAGSSYSNYLLLKKNDFAYNKSATKEYPEGFIALYSGDELAAVPNSIFTCFRIKGESPVPQYLNYLFLGNLHGQWLRKFIEVGARAHGSLSIDEDDLLALPVPLPSGKASVREQQKIAECLSSAGELIASQARKVDALKTHKKGLMQQLFPREGETQPRLRFPEFKKAGHWKLRKIGNMIVETQRPIALSDEAEYRLVTVKRRYGGLISRGNMKGREILVKSQFVVRAGDFLISKRQIVHNACGLVPQELDGSVVSNEYSVLTPKPECSIDFFSWFAMQPSVSASFMNCSVGIVIEKMLFKLPAWLKQKFLFPSLPEQRCVASCLSSLDALITDETQKLEALKTHKKGLMQQLFPSPEQ